MLLKKTILERQRVIPVLDGEKIPQTLTEHTSDIKNQTPYNLEVRTPDRSQIANLIFPPYLEGASVLDVDCTDGFFCFEAKRRSAGRVVGINVDGDHFDTAIKHCKVLNTDIEFLQRNGMDVEGLGAFDYVLSFNILRRVKDPAYIISELTHIIGRKLVFEVTGLHVEASEISRRWWKPLFKLLTNLSQTAVPGADSRNRLLMTRKWVEELFQNQYSKIESIEFSNSTCPNQYLVLVSMRRVNDLRIISGPSGVGKSVFVDKLRSNDPKVVQLLDFNLEDGWELVMAKDLKTSAGRKIDKLLLHYDIAKPLERSCRIHEDDPALVIPCAATKVVYVLVCPPDILIRRVRKRVLSSFNFKRIKRAKRQISEYSQPDRLRQLYENWVSYCKAQGCEINYINVSSDEVKTVTEEEALKLVSSTFK